MVQCIRVSFKKIILRGLGNISGLMEKSTMDNESQIKWMVLLNNFHFI